MSVHMLPDRLALAGSLVAALVLGGVPGGVLGGRPTVLGIPVASRADTTARIAPTDPLPGTDTLHAVHLLRRATYGARPEDVATVLRIGADAWLDRQLHPERIDDDTFDTRLTAFPAAGMSIAELYRSYPPRARGAAGASRDSITPEMRRERMRRGPRQIVADLVGARLQRAAHSERQLEEVMTDFWFNHFNVYFGKGQVRWLVSDYERTAIRPHVFGKFEEMLVATASHPAMLIYLDNWTSRVPDSANPATAGRERLLERLRSLPPEQRDALLRRRNITPERRERIERAAQRTRERPRGLNENYARELLELHTLGVDGGYSQQDVIEVARAFTGWTITWPRPADGREERTGAGDAESTPIHFVFRPAMHDRRGKVVLGQRLPADRGREDGIEILHMLAHHPATAHHIATKLARHFVADDPPPGLVDRLATVFVETGGDLRAVTRALFTSEEFYDPRYYGAKIKRPFEVVTSALRVTGTDVEDSREVIRILREFGNLPYLEPAPTGYPTSKEEWVSSGAMLNRMNFALALAAGRLEGVSPAAAELEWRERTARAGSRTELVAAVAAHILPGTDTGELEAIVSADLQAQETSDPQTLTARALGLVLGSPEFQRR